MIKPQRIETVSKKQKENKEIDLTPGKIDIDPNSVISEEIEEETKKEKKKSSILLPLFLSFLGVFTIGSIYDTYYRFLSIFQNAPMLGFLYLLSFVIFIGILIYIGIKQFAGYKKLKDIENKQQIAKKLQENPSQEVFTFAKEILKVYKDHENEEIRKIAAEIEKDLDEKVILKEEVLEILDEKLFSKLDQEAYKLISKYSNQTALSTAISPVALIDMMLILSRSWAMISQIAKLYAFKPNFASRMLLLKKVSANLIFASVTDLASDYLSSVIGTSLLSKLSYHSAQGLANGVLIARIGVSTIKTCRIIYLRKRINYVEYIAKKLLETLLGRAQAKE